PAIMATKTKSSNSFVNDLTLFILASAFFLLVETVADYSFDLNQTQVPILHSFGNLAIKAAAAATPILCLYALS
ncbi:MAG: hypothetical protein KAS69_06265, partial [Planctomycetes bacterium]|nr:hypothetical protein [Planctomycetota bacterium]